MLVHSSLILQRKLHAEFYNKHCLYSGGPRQDRIKVLYSRSVCVLPMASRTRIQSSGQSFRCSNKNSEIIVRIATSQVEPEKRLNHDSTKLWQDKSTI